MIVILNCPVLVLGTESEEVQVTTVTPTGYLAPDVTTWPVKLSVHTTAVAPSTTSLADGVRDQATTASRLPVSTFWPGTLAGRVSTGPSLSAWKQMNDER